MRRRSSGRPTMQVRELSPTNESRRTCVNLLALNGRCAPRRPSARIHSCIPHVTTHQRHHSAPLGSAKYCDERVCVCVCVCACAFVCLRSYIRNYTSDLHRVFFTHVTYGRGSVLLWRRSGVLCRPISGFIYDVIFVDKQRLLDVAAQPKHSAHAALKAWL